ncbi:MAG: hypothetical protein GTO55_10680 [Armatimonadetes bacterium]|nr:hypothetical protein [Armatimonadota bacterium]NIM24697.1 hypothetical protein [Armatimonadota bacterium]NIM68577.1 hypothetical protein [Armatimonadota bacterium]NIM77094.1 hypothetical protein [Armatimonadota bacterium]NIN06771.1 hypothetical protein [Armatimonadota bacterium]
MRRASGSRCNKPRVTSNISSPSKRAMSRSFLSRLRIWAFLMLALFGLVAGRLIQIQVFRHDYYRGRAIKTHGRERTVSAPRGAILDRNGKPLAMNLSQELVFVDPELFHDCMEAAKDDEAATAAVKKGCDRLAALLKMDLRTLQRKLDSGGRFRVLKRPVADALAEKIQRLRLRWVGLQSEEKRVYPHGKMAAHILGFVSTDGRGLGGIESALNDKLAGRPGKISMEVDSKGRDIPGSRTVSVPPEPGRDITLTLDASLQQVAEAGLAEGIENASAVGGTVVMMDPYSGEILALASQPAFDPNRFKESPSHRWVSPAVVGAYEPGSTFKLVVACAILEEKIPLSSTQMTCIGERRIGHRTIHCALHEGKRDHGKVDLDEIIEESCNIGAAALAQQLGREKFSHHIEALGFGEKSGIELGGESSGQMPAPSTWSDIRIANIGFGQGISVTPLQLLRAYCAVANGGLLVRPHLVRTDEEEPAKRVLSPETAQRMREIFVHAVERGTGEAAAIEGYQVAGKTGTSQKPVPGLGFRSGKYIGSFVGFVPADNPRLALLVIIDEPAHPHFGAVVAAPVFREIARQALLYFEIPPSPVIMQAQGSNPLGLNVDFQP